MIRWSNKKSRQTSYNSELYKINNKIKDGYALNESNCNLLFKSVENRNNEISGKTKEVINGYLGKLNTYSKLYDNDYNFLFKSIENINKEILDNVKNVIKNKINEIDKKIIKNNHVIKYSDCDFLFKIVTANIQVTIVNEAKILSIHILN